MEQTKRSRSQLFNSTHPQLLFITLLLPTSALLISKQYPDTKERFVSSNIELGQGKELIIDQINVFFPPLFSSPSLEQGCINNSWMLDVMWKSKEVKLCTINVRLCSSRFFFCPPWSSANRTAQTCTIRLKECLSVSSWSFKSNESSFSILIKRSSRILL